MYANFEDTVDIEKEFPLITKPSNELKIGEWDTELLDTNKAGSSYVS